MLAGRPLRTGAVGLMIAVAGCVPGLEETRVTADAGVDQADTVEERRSCAPPPGVSGRPLTIAQAVDLIDALPKPTTIACLVESLERPLDVTLTDSFTSAQPAHSARSPRVFIHSGQLFLSIVPEGPGRPLLEFGELVGPTTSIKGELDFPVRAPLNPAAPFDTILRSDGEGTNCGTCHRSETLYPEIDYARAYTSTALRPRWQDHVAVEDLKAEWEACDPEVEPDRCGILDALFGWGPVREVEFPSTLPTLFE